MQPVHDAPAPKNVVNLSVNANLLSGARELSIDLSATLEQAWIHALEQHRREQWLARNRDAIAAYNEHLEVHGVFSAGVRSF
jgi:antitoxin CcdA